MGAPTTELPGRDVRLMTAAEIDAELERLDARRRLLLRVRRLFRELNGEAEDDE